MIQTFSREEKRVWKLFFFSSPPSKANYSQYFCYVYFRFQWKSGDKYRPARYAVLQCFLCGVATIIQNELIMWPMAQFTKLLR